MSTAPQEYLRRIELSAAEEKGVRSAGRLMGIAAVVTVLGTLASSAKLAAALLWGPPQTAIDLGANVAGAAIGLVLSLLLAAWLVTGARALARVVDTDDDDQGNFMRAIHKLQQVFALKVTVVIVTLFIGIAAAIVAAIAGAS